MRSLIACFLLLCASAVSAQTRSPYLEDLTWPELRDAIAGGATTAVIAAGGIEQNGPHMALVKHNLIARHVSGEVARRLNGIAYPVIPFSMAGDPIEKTNHSRWPGTISISSEVFVGLVRQVAVAARAAGFKTIVLLGDHGGGTGGGQGELALVAQGLDADWRGGGVRVVYASNAGSGTAATAYLKERNIAAGGHAGMAETAQVIALDEKKTLIRQDKYPVMAAGPDTATGAAPVNLAPATAEMGRAFLEMKIADTVAQVRKALPAK
jgi:creatinine amidohydrolase/Fe(II)-dependent formamide hydrolase-like protein